MLRVCKEGVDQKLLASEDLIMATQTAFGQRAHLKVRTEQWPLSCCCYCLRQAEILIVYLVRVIKGRVLVPQNHIVDDWYVSSWIKGYNIKQCTKNRNDCIFTWLEMLWVLDKGQKYRTLHKNRNDCSSTWLEMLWRARQ